MHFSETAIRSSSHRVLERARELRRKESALIKTLNFITTRHSFPLLLLVFNGFMIPSIDA